MLRMSGRVADVSRGLRAVVSADRDDRSPRRDGPQRLSNAYEYFGDPWNDEVTIMFRDEFGAFSTGRDNLKLPVISWQKPSAVKYASAESANRYMNDPMSYGFSLICNGEKARPFASLGKLLQLADQMTSDMCRSKPVVMPEPSREDLAKARQLHSAWVNGRGIAGAKAIDLFLAENGIGKLPEREKAKPGRQAGFSR